MEIFRRLLAVPQIRNARAATDGAQDLVTLQSLGSPPPLTFEIGMSEGTTEKYTVTITAQAPIDPDDLLKSLRNIKNRAPFEDEAVPIRIFNILMGALTFGDSRLAVRGKERNKIIRIDNGKITSDLGGGVECLRCFFSSVRFASGRILLNLNVNHGTFYRPGPLPRLFDEFRRLHGNDLKFLSRYVRGCRIEVTHLPKIQENGRMTYRQKSIWALAQPSDGRSKDPEKTPPMKHPPNVPYVGANAEEVEFYWEKKDSAGKPTGPAKYVTVTRYFQECMYKHLPSLCYID